jgi:hypothetical protein
VKAFDKDRVAFERTAEGEAYEKRADERALPTAEQAAAMRAILENHAALGLGISRAAACDAWASVGDFSAPHQRFINELLERIQNFRGAARYAHMEALVLASEGRRDEAVRRGVELLKLARLSEAEPTLVANLVTIAVRGVAIDAIERTLASGAVSAEVRKELDAELAANDAAGRFAAMLRLERGAAFDAFDQAVPGDAPRVLLRMFGWYAKGMYTDAFESMSELIKLADGPWANFRRHVQPWTQRGATTGHGVLADLLAPAIAAAAEAHDRDVAKLRSLRVLNLLEGYVAEHGEQPTGLGELELPAGAIADPVSGGPLLAKRVGETWAVYGVGKNGKDDGGTFRDLLDVGVGPSEAREAAESDE